MNAYEGYSISERFEMSRKARETYISFYGEIPEGMEIDHIDCNPLNNDIENLRLVTRSENLRNRRKFTMNKNIKESKYKGVYWCRRRNKWIAQMRYNKKTYYIGQFDCEDTAYKEWLLFRDSFTFLD